MAAFCFPVGLKHARGILKSMKDDQQNYWQDDAEAEAPAEETRRDDQGADDAQTVTWSAEEYVHLDKDWWWYVVFVVVVLGFVAFDVLVLRSWTFSLLVIVMAVAVVVYIRRPPRTLTYALSGKQGLYVGERLYHLDDFRSFGLIRDNEHHSIMLIPTKRFAPGVSVYFPEDVGEKVVDILGQRLPMQELKLDVIDVLVRKLRL